jgi:hypothetical protein
MQKMFDELNKLKITSLVSMTNDNGKKYFKFVEESEDLSDAVDEQDQVIGEISSDYETGDKDDDEDSWTFTKSKFDGLQKVNAINFMLKESYLKIKINETATFLHKQSACWLLSTNVIKLSSDSLTHAMQQTTIADR